MAKSSSKKAPSRKSAGKDSSGAKGGRMIYSFGEKKCDGDGTMKSLLGGKGANLAEMARIGLSVPPGFTITTTTCADFHDSGGCEHRDFRRRGRVCVCVNITQNFVIFQNITKFY